MTDPIIPGIDDARAREIARWFSRAVDNFVFTDEFQWGERAALRRMKLIRPYRDPDFTRITPAGRALWERIKAE